jgi:hypothetical protein
MLSQFRMARLSGLASLGLLFASLTAAHGQTLERIWDVPHYHAAKLDKPATQWQKAADGTLYWVISDGAWRVNTGQRYYFEMKSNDKNIHLLNPFTIEFQDPVSGNVIWGTRANGTRHPWKFDAEDWTDPNGETWKRRLLNYQPTLTSPQSFRIVIRTRDPITCEFKMGQR